MHSIPNHHSIQHLSNLIVSQRKHRSENILQLLDNLQHIKDKLNQSELQDVRGLIEKAIDQCQELKLLN